MEKNQMKNIVVLKNLPSNLIEEAIVILKSKKNVKKFQYIDSIDKSKKKLNNEDSKNYIVKEAENVISNYINKLDKKDKNQKDSELNKKYKKIKIYSIAITILCLIMAIV